jgi:hypothetical protein
VRRRVAVLLGIVAIGAVALALALILRSEVLGFVGVLAFVPTLMTLWIGALFAQRRPVDRRRDHGFLAWLWRESAGRDSDVEGSGDGRDRGPAG